MAIISRSSSCAIYGVVCLFCTALHKPDHHTNVHHHARLSPAGVETLQAVLAQELTARAVALQADLSQRSVASGWPASAPMHQWSVLPDRIRTPANPRRRKSPSCWRCAACAAPAFRSHGKAPSPAPRFHACSAAMAWSRSALLEPAPPSSCCHSPSPPQRLSASRPAPSLHSPLPSAHKPRKLSGNASSEPHSANGPTPPSRRASPALAPLLQFHRPHSALPPSTRLKTPPHQETIS